MCTNYFSVIYYRLFGNDKNMPSYILMFLSNLDNNNDIINISDVI